MTFDVKLEKYEASSKIKIIKETQKILQVPSNEKWNECGTCCFEIRKKAYHALENIFK